MSTGKKNKNDERVDRAVNLLSPTRAGTQATQTTPAQSGHASPAVRVQAQTRADEGASEPQFLVKHLKEIKRSIISGCQHVVVGAWSLKASLDVITSVVEFATDCMIAAAVDREAPLVETLESAASLFRDVNIPSAGDDSKRNEGMPFTEMGKHCRNRHCQEDLVIRAGIFDLTFPSTAKKLWAIHPAFLIAYAGMQAEEAKRLKKIIEEVGMPQKEVDLATHYLAKCSPYGVPPLSIKVENYFDLRSALVKYFILHSYATSTEYLSRKKEFYQPMYRDLCYALENQCPMAEESGNMPRIARNMDGNPIAPSVLAAQQSVLSIQQPTSQQLPSQQPVSQQPVYQQPPMATFSVSPAPTFASQPSAEALAWAQILAQQSIAAQHNSSLLQASMGHLPPAVFSQSSPGHQLGQKRERSQSTSEFPVGTYPPRTPGEIQYCQEKNFCLRCLRTHKHAQEKCFSNPVKTSVASYFRIEDPKILLQYGMKH